MERRPAETAIAVFERTPYWGPELQRSFHPPEHVVRECRALSDVLPSIESFRHALLVIDFDHDAADVLCWLNSDFLPVQRSLPVVMCGSARTKDLEWVVRECGITAFLPGPIPGAEFARLCRRLLHDLPSKRAIP